MVRGMVKIKEFFFRKHRPDCSKKFMSHSKDCLPVDKSLSPSPIIVFPEVFIMHDHTYAHKPHYSSQMSVSSFTDFTFSFKPTRFINSGVNSTISDELLWRIKPLNITYFSQKMHSSNVTDTLYRFQDFNVLTKRGLFTEFSKHIGEEFKLFLKEEKLFNFLNEDHFFYRPVPSDGFFSKEFNFLGTHLNGSSCCFRTKSFLDLLHGGVFESMSRRKLREEFKGRGIVDVYNSLKLREEHSEMFFDIIFNSSDLLGNFFSFSCDITEILWEEGFIREMFMYMIQRDSDKFSISSIGFGFSEGSGEEFIDKQGIKNKAGEVFLSKISKKIDVIAARGFFSDKDRVFRERGEFFNEVFETRKRHRENGFKEDILWRVKSTDGEGVFRDINTHKNPKDIVGHSNTSNLRVYVAEAGACGPILHGHEGLIAQPTYHGLSRQATNSLEGLLA